VGHGPEKRWAKLGHGEKEEKKGGEKRGFDFFSNPF
jgi:hypothetical protein